MEPSKMTTKALESEYMEYVQEWDKTNEVFSLTEFEEIIVELTKRKER